MMKIAICDDEDIFIEKWTSIINRIKHSYNYNIEIFTFKSGKDLIKYMIINDVKFDLVFQDIIMEEINGIETAKNIKEIYEYTEIVFLTCSKDYALDGYDIKVFNYIIKNCENLEVKIEEAINHCYSRKNDYIIINNKASVEKIEISKIVYVESNKRKIIVNTTDSQYETYEKLDNIYYRLKNFGFIKTHRSYVVNIEHIKKIEPKQLVTTIRDVIPISRGNTDIVRAKFMEYLEYTG